MILTTKEFTELATAVSAAETGVCAIDFETDGLRPQVGAKAFLLGFTWGVGKYSVWLEDPETYPSVRKLIWNPQLDYAAHNATFEMSFLEHQFHCRIQGKIWDTEVMARLQFNDHRGYSLQACSERLNLSKHSEAVAWLKGSPRGEPKRQHKDMPHELLIPYVEMDAWLSLQLYQHQKKFFEELDSSSPLPVKPLIKLEEKTTRHIHNMQMRGIRVDLDYCAEALKYECGREADALMEFKRLTGKELVMSAKCLKPIFDAEKIPYGKTEKGNPSFDYDSIQGDHPIVRAIITAREAAKRATTYWGNYLAMGSSGRIYPSIRQAGTATGRFSCADPNLQNIPTDDAESPYPVRRAFLADEGCQIVSMDYRGMEYRLIADEAQDERVIAAIQNGEDTHAEIARAAGVPRSKAKNGVFARLYGAGVPRLALTLGVDLPTAERVAAEIDRKGPGIARYARTLTAQAARSGKGYNFLGRRYAFSRKFAYKLPDYRTQGGCADILRIAIARVHNFLVERAHDATGMIVPIHDEIVFNFDPRDLGLIPAIRRIMINAHINKKSLEMDVSVATGPNFHDLEEHHA